MPRPAVFVLASSLLLLAGCAATSAPAPHITARGNPVTLNGTPPAVGQRAPAFTAVANDMSTFHFTPGDGQVYILSSVPSLDTKVCSLETRHFNEDAAHLPPNVHLITISMDLPFAQKRWCAAEGITRVTTVSDFRDRSFSHAYHLRINQTGLLARALFVIGPDGTITYRQIVPELTHEPDYAPVIAAAKAATP